MSIEKSPGYKGTLSQDLWKNIQVTKDGSGYDFADSGKTLDLESHADLNLSWTNFEGCTFFEAKLPNVRFDYAVLNNCNCRRVDFKDASFIGAQLVDVDFSGADLTNVRFVDCKMSCGFYGADLTGALFDNCDLGFSTFYQIPLMPGQIRNCATAGCTKPNGKRVSIIESFRKTFI